MTLKYRLAKLAGRLVFSPAFRLRSRNPERIPKSGRLIVAANHTSYLDPVVLGTVFPRQIRFLMLKSIYDRLACKWFCVATGAIPIDRDKPSDLHAMKAALRVLSEEGVMGIFPEGGRSKTDTMMNFEPGLVRLAARAKAPILPAAIVGTRKAFPSGRLIPHPVSIEVRFGEPLPAPAKGQEDECLKQLRAVIEGLLLE